MHCACAHISSPNRNRVPFLTKCCFRKQHYRCVFVGLKGNLSHTLGFMCTVACQPPLRHTRSVQHRLRIWMRAVRTGPGDLSAHQWDFWQPWDISYSSGRLNVAEMTVEQIARLKSYSRSKALWWKHSNNIEWCTKYAAFSVVSGCSFFSTSLNTSF